MELSLGPRQKSAIGTALTLLAAVVILASLGGIFFAIGMFFSTFSGVFLPVAVAGVVALVLKPYFDWLSSFRRIPKVLALVLVFISLLIPVVAIGWFFGAVIVGQISDLVGEFPAWWEQASRWTQERWPAVQRFLSESPIAHKLTEALQDRQEELLAGLGLVGGKALSAGAGVLRGIGTLFSWAVLPVYIAFFLLMSPGPIDTQKLLPFLKTKTREDAVYLAREFVNIIVAFFRGQLLVALSQGMLFALGFTLVGLKYGLILGIMLGFLNIIPYLGSIIGLGIALPLAFFQGGGGWITALLVLAVFAIVQMIEGYYLTPRIMGDRTGLHPMVIMIAMFFWGSALGGIVGMILAIPLTAFLVVFWRLAREKYIGELV